MGTSKPQHEPTNNNKNKIDPYRSEAHTNKNIGIMNTQNTNTKSTHTEFKPHTNNNKATQQPTSTHTVAKPMQKQKNKIGTHRINTLAKHWAKTKLGTTKKTNKKQK